MRLIVISSSSDKIEHEPQILTKMFEAGLETLHLRKPKFSTKQLTEYIKSIPEHFHDRIVIHSHHNLARKFNLKGVHLTKTHKRKPFKMKWNLRLLKLKNPKAIVSTSNGRLAGLFEDDYEYSYSFLSPVFNSISGKYQSGFTEHSLKSAINRTGKKIIARGGVDIYCIEKVNEIGFDGMALFSAIWKKPDPLKEFNNIVARCAELGIPIE